MLPLTITSANSFQVSREYVSLPVTVNGSNILNCGFKLFIAFTSIK